MLHLKEVHNEILEIEIDSFQPEEPQDDSNPKARRTENDQKFVQQMSTILTKAQINEFRTKGRAFFSNSISVVEFYKVFDALFKERKNQMFTLMLASMPGGNQRKVLNRFHIDAVSGGIEYAQKRFEDQENFRQPPRVDPPPAVLEAPSHSVHEPLPEPPPASPARQEVTPPAPKKKKKNRGFVVVDF